MRTLFDNIDKLTRQIQSMYLFAEQITRAKLKDCRCCKYKEEIISVGQYM